MRIPSDKSTKFSAWDLELISGKYSTVQYKWSFIVKISCPVTEGSFALCTARYAPANLWGDFISWSMDRTPRFVKLNSSFRCPYLISVQNNSHIDCTFAHCMNFKTFMCSPELILRWIFSVHVREKSQNSSVPATSIWSVSKLAYSPNSSLPTWGLHCVVYSE